MHPLHPRERPQLGWCSSHQPDDAPQGLYCSVATHLKNLACSTLSHRRLVDVDMNKGTVLHPYVWSLGAFWPGLQVRCTGGLVAHQEAPAGRRLARECWSVGCCPSLCHWLDSCTSDSACTSTVPAGSCWAGGGGCGAAQELERSVEPLWLAARNVRPGHGQPPPHRDRCLC